MGEWGGGEGEKVAYSIQSVLKRQKICKIPDKLFQLG